MKKVVIASDSHGLTAPLMAIKERHPDAELLIHCGDSELERDDAALDGFVAVGGNCDFNPGFPDEEVVDFAGKKIFVTHGHFYSVKSTIMNIQYRARELGADIICFGHSHLLGAEMSGGLLFLNPGSIRLPRGRREKTYIVLGIGEGMYEVSVYDIDRGEIAGLKQVFQQG